MNNTLEILSKLRNLSGNEQISYLSQNRSDVVKEVLLYTYDPHKRYKIDSGKYNKVLTAPVTEHQGLSVDVWNEFKAMLDKLSEMKSATDEVVKKVKSFIETVEPESSRDFLKMVLTKDLKLNMAVKKFQKVWSDFLVEPQVQLALPKDDRPNFTKGLYSRKFDGKRMYIMDGNPYSRSNKLCYTNPVQHILEQIHTLFNGEENLFVIDGECLFFDNGKEDFQKGISLCQSEDRKDGCDNVCYVIFDIIPKENFITKTPWKNFGEEYFEMICKYSCATMPSPDYSLLPTRTSNIFIARQDEDPSKLMSLREQKNWEGLMYRNAYAPYEFKRTNNLLKIKSMKDMELQLIDMEEGTGRNTGKLGAFVVDYKGSSVKVGSGFSDELREEYFNNKEKYIGKYVKVQYFEETVDQNGSPSLRFPVFLDFRDVVTSEEFLVIK